MTPSLGTGVKVPAWQVKRESFIGGVPSPQELSYLPAGFDLESDLRDQLSTRTGNQRCISGQDELLLIVHEVPKPGVPEREPLLFWKTAGEWMGPDGSKGFTSLSRLLTRYQSAIDKHEATIDSPDSASEVFSVARHAGPLARSMRNMGVALDQALSFDNENKRLLGMRDRAREIERAAELLYHDAKLTLDFTEAERAEEHQAAAERLNKIAFRLNLMAGFFLPLVALGGLMGMNVDLPEFTKPLFWWIFWSGLLLGILVVFLVSWEATQKK